MLRKGLLKVLTALLILGTTTTLVILGLLYLEHGSPITLPEPTGEFAVARTMCDWVDNSRIDSLAPVPDQKRELIVWIWYPAATNPSAQPAEYLPGPWRSALEQYQDVVVSKFFTRDLSLVHGHSLQDTDVSSVQSNYPVVIMKPGLGALATDYTTLAEDLASHGFIVVGSDATYSSTLVVFSDGRVAARTAAGHPPDNLPDAEQARLLNELMTVWSADVRFVLDQLERLNADPSSKFTGRLNLQSVGAFGHSFGGATAAQFCHDDHRCKAGIDLDGSPFGSVIQEGLTQPFMFLLSDDGDTPDEGSRQVLGNIKGIRDSDKGSCLMASVRGTRHFNFSDQSLLKDRYMARIFGALGPIDARRALAITAAYVHTFFDVHLKNAPASRLESLADTYPEVRLVQR